MVKKITIQDMHNAFMKAIEERGADFVYTPPVTEDGRGGDCVYVFQGEPSCIVGCAVATLAPDIFQKMVKRADDAMEDEENESGVETIYAPKEFDYELGQGTRARFTDEALRYATAVQGLQDRGTPWGEAVQKEFEIAQEL